MAKKRAQYIRQSKSARIRDVLQALDSMDDMDAVCAALNKRKIKYSKTEVYRIRKELRGSGDGHDDLLSVKRFADKVGGINKLKNLISVLEKLQ